PPQRRPCEEVRLSLADVGRERSRLRLRRHGHHMLLASGEHTHLPEAHLRPCNSLLQCLEVAGDAAAAEDRQGAGEGCAAGAREEIRVVEVDVHDGHVETGSQRRARGHAERVRRRELEQTRAARQDEPGGCRQLQARSALGQVGGAERRRGAVRVAELGQRLRERLVHVPAAAAEDGRLEAVRAKPRRLAADALGVLRPGGRGPRPLGGDEVRVVAERPPCRGLPRPRQPALRVLPRRPVGWAHERRDPEAARASGLQCREARPAGVVERTRDVAGDDRVPLCGDVRHLRTSSTVRKRRSRPCRPHEGRARAPRAGRGFRRRLRRLRARAPAPARDRPRDRRSAGGGRAGRGGRRLQRRAVRVGRPPAAARARARAGREEAARVDEARRRHARLRLRGEGAPAPPAGATRGRPRAARRLPRAPVRARRYRAARDREAAARPPARRRGRLRPRRALRRASRARAAERRRVARARPCRGARGGRAPAGGRRPARGAPVRRPRLERRRGAHGAGVRLRAPPRPRAGRPAGGRGRRRGRARAAGTLARAPLGRGEGGALPGHARRAPCRPLRSPGRGLPGSAPPGAVAARLRRPQDGLRRPPLRPVQRPAGRARRRRAARPVGARPRPAAPGRRRAPARRARLGARRPRPPPVVPRRARAVAARLGRGGRGDPSRRGRRPMTGRRAYALVVATCVLPRLAVLLHERGAILANFTEKSDDFARTFVHSGTFGFVPGQPSAWTQPLYSFFLIPVYWMFGRNWPAVGLSQIALAAATAVLVYEIGRRFLSPRAGLVAAVVSTLNPYLIWHDVHVNREIVDQLFAAAVVLLTLVAADRRTARVKLAAVALGVVLGLAILGNTRLIVLPVVVCGFVLWQRRRVLAPALAVGVCALALVPWAARTDASVGCFTLTTDARALWKANNEHTYATLAAGKWIDDVPRIPGSPYTPEEAETLYYQDHKLVHVDECAQMRFYRHKALAFMVDHPAEKAKLMGQAVRMLWDPRVQKTEGRPGAGGFVDRVRTWVQPVYEIPLY